MLQDAQRYVPALKQAHLAGSMFEVKTVLPRNEVDDGRPILVERSDSANPVFSVMGGKVDNIYDVLDRLDAELL